ncbi:hypothetical protein [uncultured Draconibacterium sp.]|uniref:hypothetical protein n=1 Tax=uncultured Draconibacterium sp. TaxID=1573823 RepID=UPI003217D384
MIVAQNSENNATITAEKQSSKKTMAQKAIMKKALIYLVFIFASTNWSCDKQDKCIDVDCFTPPPPFVFELVDKTTGENLFTSGVLSSEDIQIVNLDDNSNVEFQFIDENDFNVIHIYSIGWKTQTITYSIEISSERLFTLFVDAERLSKNCCAFTRYNEIEIDGSEFELNGLSGIYKLLVE